MGEPPSTLEPDALLPPLREDLRILSGDKQRNGDATWLLFDPLRHRYFQIDKQAMRLLGAWSLGAPARVLDQVETAELIDIERLLRFLLMNSLTRDPPSADERAFVEQAKAGEQSWYAALVHRYLFFKIPLFRPHAFLSSTEPLTRIFFSRAWWIFIAALAVTGLYLASRQWDQFVHTFVFFFNLQGLSYYFIALISIKILHELGHAYAATRYGCRVSTMGVAFLVMFPVLFTDTTDGWKLASRRRRLTIDAAGVCVELMVAAVATLFWVFLPDGPWRSAAFFIATTSWVMSLAVNLNPLMRFDGYHFLADLTGVKNLQARSFALGRWALREALFRLGAAAPEPETRIRRRLLVLFAWSCWVYRFFLFIGIGLLVHALFPKPLGAILFVIEIAWFIAAPVINEIGRWSSLLTRDRFQLRQSAPAVLTAIALVAMVIPWRSTVRIPAVMEAAREAQVFPLDAGEIVALHVRDGETVTKGDLLLTLHSPALDAELRKAALRIALAEARLARVAADAETRDQRIVVAREAAQARQAMAVLREAERSLNVVAPISGVIVDLDPHLHARRWVNRTTPIAIVKSASGAQARGYLTAAQLSRIETGAHAVFTPDHAERARRVGSVRTIGRMNAETIAVPALASRFNGPIAVSENERALTPLASRYSIVVEFDADVPPPAQILRGEITAKARSESFALMIWRRVAGVFVRETSL
ncbi:MAG: HlyD family efflux transporter periplasmic adaptor subunit [Pseudomonadota bacterium]